MNRKKKWYAYAGASAVLFGCLGFAYYAYGEWNAVSIDPERSYPVVHVVDGDTFQTKIGRHIVTVRLLGVNTPETVDPRKPAECYGREASDAVKKLLSGRSIRLALNPDREVTDKYGRYLAYARLDDGIFVNEFLLSEGLAREYTYGSPYMFQQRFRGLEKEAKEAGKGLWGSCKNAEK